MPDEQYRRDRAPEFVADPEPEADMDNAGEMAAVEHIADPEPEADMQPGGESEVATQQGGAESSGQAFTDPEPEADMAEEQSRQ